MRIGILGSGLMGAKLGTIFARAGHEVTFSYARSEQKLKRLARAAKASYGSPRDAARDADAVLLAEIVAGRGDLRAQPESIGDPPTGGAARAIGVGDRRQWAHHRPYLVGRRTTGEEDPQGSRRAGVQHRAERGVVRCVRRQAKGCPAEPCLLRR